MSTVKCLANVTSLVCFCCFVKIIFLIFADSSIFYVLNGMLSTFIVSAVSSTTPSMMGSNHTCTIISFTSLLGFYAHWQIFHYLFVLRSYRFYHVKQHGHTIIALFSGHALKNGGTVNKSPLNVDMTSYRSSCASGICIVISRQKKFVFKHFSQLIYHSNLIN